MMHFSLTQSLRLGASAVCLSAALMMGACGPKDKGGAPTISAEKAPLGLSGLSDKDFASHFSIPKRKVSDANAEKALAALGLNESNTNGLSWSNKSGSDGNYIFTDMKSTSDEGTISIGKAQLFGVHMEGDQATFDRADFNDFTLKGDDVVLKVNAMSLARPTADTAKALVQSLETLDDDLDLDFGDDAKFGFGALSMKSVDVTAEEVTGTIDQLVWGADETTGRADFKLEKLDLNIPQNGSDIASLLTLKSVSARGFKSDDITKGLSSGASGDTSGLMSLLSGYNAYEKPYDNMKLEGLKFDSAAIEVDVPKVEAEALVKGDITTMTQVMEPMSIKMKDNVQGPAQQAYGLLKELGFDTMTFKSSQTTILDKGEDTMRVEDGILDMADGFRLNYKYGASGLAALGETQAGEAAQLENVLENMKINGMTLSLEDKSIVERGLKLAAQMRGADENRVKQELRAALTFAPLAARNDLERDVISELGGAFMDFIDDGGTLTIELAPETPIALSSLDAVDELSSKDIGFSARQDN